jgi:hypothetical protein
MDSEAPPRVWISFDLFGATFDPASITRQLGIEPGQSHRAGDAIREDKGRWPRDRWRITIGPRATTEIGDMLSEVLDRLAPAEHALAQMLGASELEAMITCAVEPRSALTPYILFPVEVVAWAAVHDVALAVDLMLASGWSESPY